MIRLSPVTTRLDPLSLDELYGHLLAHEMRIEHHLSPTEPSLPVANFSAQTPMPRERGRSFYHGRGLSNGDRGRSTYF
jgi:hypothetical protein